MASQVEQCPLTHHVMYSLGAKPGVSEKMDVTDGCRCSVEGDLRISPFPTREKFWDLGIMLAAEFVHVGGDRTRTSRIVRLSLSRSASVDRCFGAKIHGD